MKSELKIRDIGAVTLFIACKGCNYHFTASLLQTGLQVLPACPQCHLTTYLHVTKAIKGDPYAECPNCLSHGPNHLSDCGCSCHQE